MKEIERRFLIKSNRDLDNETINYLNEIKTKESIEIKQKYLHLSSINDKPRFDTRIRLHNETAFLTTKFYNSDKIDGINEFEYEIPYEDGLYMFNEILHKPIEKNRFHIQHGKFTLEYDIFKGENSGLEVVEVEFNSIEEAEAFNYHIPHWFGIEITEDKRYNNRNLYQNPYNTFP
jgi:adenylate cyclase